MKPEISFNEIKNLATLAGQEEWHDFLKSVENPFSDEILNYKNAWMFLRNKKMLIPEERSLFMTAIVVSERGEVRLTADFDGDLNKCMEYLKTMAAHFTERGL